MAVSGEGTSSEPRRPYPYHAPGRLEAHRSSTAASSKSGGTDPPVQADDSKRQQQLLMIRWVDIPELPQLESEGAIVQRPSLSGWLYTMAKAISRAGPLPQEWWYWVLQEATRSLRNKWNNVFSGSPLNAEGVDIQEAPVPGMYSEIENFMQPKVLQSLPVFIREWVNMRSESTEMPTSSILIYYAIRSSEPEEVNEWTDLLNAISTSRSLSKLRVARIEMTNWKTRLGRI